tara:strand:- start:1954 stop:4497 length:2544 start_codon:yes stop_codon:yes gene_type:complete
MSKLSEMRKVIQENNLKVATSGRGRTKEVIKKEICAQLAKRKRVDNADVSNLKIKTKREKETFHVSEIAIELKNILEKHGAFLNTESIRHMNKNVSSKRVECAITDFERIQTWKEHEKIARKFASFIRNGLKYIIKDQDVRSMIVDDIIDRPSIFEQFGCSIREVDNLYRINTWWSVGDERRTQYILERIVRKEIKENKNTCIANKSIMAYSSNYEIDHNDVSSCLNTMIDDGVLVSFEDGRFLTTAFYYSCEKKIFDIFMVSNDEDRRLAQSYEEHGSRRNPTDEQKCAIENFSNFTVSFLYGPGGAGKSDVCLREIMHLSIKNEIPVCFLGFTHVVRKLLSELIEEEDDDFVHSQTIASLLREPISTSPVTYATDEASMIDTIDFARLISRAKEEGSSIVWCGDSDQLRPINAGCPFYDLISYCRKNGASQLSELTKIFRAESSQLTDFLNIYRIHKMNDENGDFWSFRQTTSRDSIDKKYKDVLRVYFTDDDKEIDAYFKNACKMYKDQGINEKDVLCVAAKNDMCKRLHMLKREVFRGVSTKDLFSKGDQCILSKNCKFYKNGDIAWIGEAYNKRGQTSSGTYHLIFYKPEPDEASLLQEEMTKSSGEQNNVDVDFSLFEPIYYEEVNMWLICVPDTNLIVGGCVTVHKAQGRGENYCIVTASRDDRHMARCDWVYTGGSRAKKGVSLVGSMTIFNNMARPRNNPPRDTVLNRLLLAQRPLPPPPPEVAYSGVDSLHTTEDALEDSKTELEAGKYRRAKIRKAVRDAVWRRDCDKTAGGQLLMTARCCCCGGQIDKDRYHCAHIVSAFDGGSDKVDNMKLCCSACNESMGTMNLLEFQQYFKE